MKPRTLALVCAHALFCVPLAKASLIGLFTFDDSGNPFNDSSGAGNHITATGGTAPVWGAAIGYGSTGAYDFTAGCLRVPVNVNASVMPKMSWGAWVRTDTIVTGTRKVLGHDDGGWDRTMGLDNRNPAIFRYTTFTGNDFNANTGPLEGTTGPTSTATWAFLTATYDQTAKTVTMYLDMDASTTADPLVAITEVAGFGAGQATMAIGAIRPDTSAEPWDGVIDQVFIYNEVLTPEKVTRIRNRGLPELQGIYNEPHIELTRATPLFGTLPYDIVPATVTRTITVKNTAPASTLTITGTTFTGANAGSYSVLSAPATLAPGAEGNIVVSLATGGINGNYTATLDVASDDPDSPSVQIPVNASVFHRLVGLYTFDDPGNPFKDSSSYLNHITGTGGTAPVYGATIGFNGTGAHDYFQGRHLVPINVNASVMPKLTWGAWVRTDTITSALYKVLGHDDGAWDRTIGLDNRLPASFRFTTFTGTANNSGPLEGTPGPVNTTDWAFIACSYDQLALTATMYVDLNAATSTDALVKITELAGFGAGRTTFAIGGIDPNNTFEPWDGVIDQVFVYRDALTQEKITAIRDRGLLELLSVPPGDPDLALSPSSMFGDLTALGPNPGPVSRMVTITNNGATQNLNVSGITVTGPDAARYSVTPPLPGPIAPGANAQVEVILTPLPAGGSYTATLNVASNDDDSPVTTVPLNSIVTTDPNIAVTAPPVLFGRMTFNAVPAAIQRSVTVRNTGVAGTLTVNAPSVSGANAGNYSIISTPATLPPGTQGDIVVSLAPGAAGSFTASLTITSNDADAAPIVVPLDATVVIVPPATLFAFYPFDDAGNPLRDESGNGRDITSTAGTDPVWGAATGVSGSGAFEFTLDQLIAPVDVNPTVMPQMTWGAFVRTNTLVSGFYKVLGHDNGGYDRTIGLDPRPDGVFHYTAFTGTGVISGSPAPVSTSEWTFIAATYDHASAITTVYVDVNAGTTDDLPQAVSAVTNFNPGWPTFAIGGIRPDVISESWDGAIDNVFVYSGILTDDQIKNIRDQGRAAIAPADNFVVTSWHINGDGTVTLTWNSKPGETYTLRYSFDLDGAVNTWADETDDIASGGATTTYTTSIPFTSQKRVFFSVERN